jgi:hypothetical protein
MPFEKGQQKKGGRQKGSINKETAVKQLIQQSLWDKVGDRLTNEGIDRAWQELSTLSGEKYLYGMLALMEYFKPKLSRATVEGGDKPIQVEQVFKIGDKVFKL